MSTMILSPSFHFDQWAEQRAFDYLARLDAISRWVPWPEVKTDDRMQLGRRVESLAAEALRDRGHCVIMTSHKTPYDILAGGARIEIKASRRYPHAKGGGRYQAAIRNHKADVFIMACCDDNEVKGWFILPAAELEGQRTMAIWSDPQNYTGKWAPFLEAWDIADRAIEEAGPHPAQLELWG